ncbi:glycosyltransferase [Halorubrum distributum]|uniref:glycosyltransferase n=1 Tax=Halorubrum distributum TaxID=29283 RepID=UPI0009B5C7B9|nr:glycosyltransferase [Halorubrum terrestre]
MTDVLFITYKCGIQAIRTANSLSRDHNFNVHILSESTPEIFEDILLDDVSVHYISDKFPVTLYRPNWIFKSATKANEIVVKNDIDLLLSRHVPIASHIVALRLSKKHNLPWIAHFGDPWIGNPYADDILRRLIYSKKLEKSIITNAVGTTFPNERIRSMYQERYPSQSGSIHVKPNSADPNRISSLSQKKINDNKLTLLHMGNFYGIRTPIPLFDAVEKLDRDIRDNIEIHFVGNVGEYVEEIQERGLSDVIYTPGSVSHDEAIKMIKGSDALVLIDAPVEDSPFLPAKLVEYCFTGNPILGITPENGTSAEVIRTTKTGEIVSPQDSDAIAKSIEQIYDKYKKGELEIDPDWNEINKYSASQATSILADIFSEEVE